MVSFSLLLLAACQCQLHAESSPRGTASLRVVSVRPCSHTPPLVGGGPDDYEWPGDHERLESSPLVGTLGYKSLEVTCARAQKGKTESSSPDTLLLQTVKRPVIPSQSRIYLVTIAGGVEGCGVDDHGG